VARFPVLAAPPNVFGPQPFPPPQPAKLPETEEEKNAASAQYCAIQQQIALHHRRQSEASLRHVLPQAAANQPAAPIRRPADNRLPPADAVPPALGQHIGGAPAHPLPDLADLEALAEALRPGAQAAKAVPKLGTPNYPEKVRGFAARLHAQSEAESDAAQARHGAYMAALAVRDVEMAAERAAAWAERQAQREARDAAVMGRLDAVGRDGRVGARPAAAARVEPPVRRRNPVRKARPGVKEE